jgi:anti-sigma factor RsiW
MTLIRGTAEMTCRELVRLITDYFEGNLSGRDRRRFERHLRHCDGCTTYLEQMRETVRVTGVVDEDALSPEARRELLAVFRGWKAR